jgi:hypothetical protein
VTLDKTTKDSHATETRSHGQLLNKNIGKFKFFLQVVFKWMNYLSRKEENVNRTLEVLIFWILDYTLMGMQALWR